MRRQIVRTAVTIHPPHLPKARTANTTANTTNSPAKILSRTAQLTGHLSQQSFSQSAMASLPVSEKGYHSKAPSVYTARKIGAPNTLEHRIYIEKDGVPLSPFHDIPLYANEQQTILNMIVEIPRWTNAKMEVCGPRFTPRRRYSSIGGGDMGKHISI